MAAASQIGNLPGAAKVGGLGVIIAAAAGAAYGLGTHNTQFLVIVAAGVVVIVVLLGLLLLIGRLRDRRKGAGWNAWLRGGGADASLSAEQKAQLDALSKRFEEGLIKYREAGRNIYKDPWFILVGESGSGKTEAIRKAAIPLIQGMQSKLQGTGGTINMDWWFTKNGILIDTAGKLMFEQVKPGTVRQWDALLNMLRRDRANCPVNGLLLMIPADALIARSTQQIDEKASQIAEQFEKIQSTLGIRFPVYLIITKCDMIEGFAEFFEHVGDGQLANQILGWSNPKPLNEPFEPESVDKYIAEVRERLVRRRLLLLQDPVNTVDPAAGRLDQVDALYTLPDSLVKIAPRLRQYLETIFVAGAWSEKPLFLRGIYFTSSLQKGAPWDWDLAQAMGVPVESLPQGEDRNRDKSYFLRDLFLEKIFSEKGLVTRLAGDIDRAYRRRKAGIMAVAALGLLSLCGATWYGANQLQEHIGRHQDFWTAVAGNADPASFAIIKQTGDTGPAQYQGDVAPGDAGSTIARTIANSQDLAQTPINIPIWFRQYTVHEDLNRQCMAAQREFIRTSLVRPLILAVRNKMKSEAWPASGEGYKRSLDVLYELVDLELATQHQPADAPNLDPLFRYVLSDSDYASYAKSAPMLNAALKSALASATQTGPAGTYQKMFDPADDQELAEQAIDNGVDEYIKACGLHGGSGVEALTPVKDRVEKFTAAEEKLRKDSAGAPPGTFDQYKAQFAAWTADLAALAAAGADLHAESDNLRKLQWDPAKPMGDLYSNLYKTGAKNRADAISQLQTHIGGSPPRTLAEAAKKLSDAANAQSTAPPDPALVDGYTQLGAWFTPCTGVAGDPAQRYELHLQMCQAVAAVLPKPDATLALVDDPVGALKQAHDSADQVSAKLGSIQADADKADAAVKDKALDDLVPALQGVVTTVAEPCQRYQVLQPLIASFPDTPDAWMKQVSSGSTDDPLPNAIALTKFGQGPDRFKDFDPASAAKLIKAHDQIQTLLQASDRTLANDDLQQKFQTTQDAFKHYRDDYVQYWTVELRDDMKIDPATFTTWQDFRKQLEDVSPTRVLADLAKADDSAQKALQAINDADPADGVARFQKAAAFWRDPGTLQECGAIRDSWVELGTTGDAAAAKLLAVKVAAFKESYQLAREDAGSEYPDYWTAIPQVALQLLAQESAAANQARLKTLQNFNRFPFAPASANLPDLTPKEVADALALARQFPSAAPAPGNGAAPADTLLTTDTDDPKLDDQLKIMRGQIGDADQHLINEIIRMGTAALPAPGDQQLGFSVSLVGGVGDSLQPDMALLQNGNALAKAINASGSGGDKLGSGSCPGGALGLWLGKTETGDVPIGAGQRYELRVIGTQMPTSWGVLRLLSDFGAKPGTNPGEWQVTVVLKGEGLNRKDLNIHLLVTFDSVHAGGLGDFTGCLPSPPAH